MKRVCLGQCALKKPVHAYPCLHEAYRAGRPMQSSISVWAVCLTGETSIGQLVGWKKGSESLAIPDGGECVGVKRTSEEKVGWKDLES